MMAVGTMKRKLKWIAAVLAVLLLGFGTALLLWPRDRIGAESWQKIRIGMTESEVENILGSSATAEFLAFLTGLFYARRAYKASTGDFS